MARKRPSAHSKEQFALFVDKIKDRLDGDGAAQFEEIVRRVIRGPGSGLDAAPSTEHSDAPPNLKAQAADERRHAGAMGHAQRQGSGLPPKPDFDAIESAARETVASRSNLLSLIGQLVFSWSNNESLLIYVIMLLLETDEPSAAVVFSTLNTTRARMDLVRRLTMIKVGDAKTRADLEELADRFTEANRVRNEFMHAMYSVNAKGEITHTHVLRFVSKNGRVSFGEQQAIDKVRIDAVIQTCADLRRLNRELWDLLPRLQKAIGRRANITPPQAQPRS
jgi:hypothetical protein